MTAAQLTDRRTARAQAIIQAGDIHEERSGYYRVRDTSGSGRWHYVTARDCSCEDFRRNGLACKHMLALSSWSSKQEAKPPSGPVCPTCGAKATPELVWGGKNGWVKVGVCTKDKYHKAAELS